MLTPGLADVLVDVMLLKVSADELVIVCVPFVPDSSIVPLLCVNVPLVNAKFPFTSSVPEGAVNAVPEIVKFPPTERFALPPTNVPPVKFALPSTAISLEPWTIVPEKPDVTVRLAASRFEFSIQVMLLDPSKKTASPVVGAPAFPVPPAVSDQFAARFEFEFEGATQ